MTENLTTHIEPYTPAWADQYTQEAKHLARILGENLLEIHHMGSTAVPGLSAKPIIDILCVVQDLSQCILLTDYNYKFMGEFHIPCHYGFNRKAPHPKINLHIVTPHHGFIALNLSFRDALRQNKDLRLTYDALKTDLAKDPASQKFLGQWKKYTLGKNKFIKSTLKTVDFSDRIVNICGHYDEWSAYHRIRETEQFSTRGALYDPNHPTIHDPNHTHMILYEGTTIVSVANIEILNKTTAALRSLATDAPYKNKGHAGFFLSFIEKWLIQNGIRCLKIHSRANVENFYRKYGYENMIFDAPPSLGKDHIDLGKILT